MSDENKTPLPEEEDIGYIREKRRRIIDRLFSDEKNLDDPDIASLALKALADQDKQALSLKKLKQDDKNAIRADNVVAQGIAAIREFSRQGFHPFRRDSTGTAITGDVLPSASKPINDGLKEEVKLTGGENYEAFEARMQELDDNTQ